MNSILSTRHEKTNILPLRWFANICERIGHYYLMKALRLDDAKKYGQKYRLYSKIWSMLYKPYYRWGTYYKLDLNIFRESIDEDDYEKE